MTYAQTLKTIRGAMKSKKRLIVFPMNIHVIAELSKNQAFKTKHQRADILFADGAPLVFLSKLKNTPLPERISGTDLVNDMLTRERCIFLLGSSPDVLAIMGKKFASICGVYSPPYARTWTREENQKIIRLINKAKTKILLVGVGPLKQEQWICSHFSQTCARVAIGVGSAFDIISGITPRAPVLLQKLGLEWAWRIAMEPKRLLPRYVGDVFSLPLLK